MVAGTLYVYLQVHSGCYRRDNPVPAFVRCGSMQMCSLARSQSQADRLDCAISHIVRYWA